MCVKSAVSYANQPAIELPLVCAPLVSGNKNDCLSLRIEGERHSPDSMVCIES
jgi:hypothetical protein